jgi:hypothetical protein
MIRENSGIGRSSHPATPPSTPADGGFCPDSPIQFDLTSPDEVSDNALRVLSGPAKFVLLSYHLQFLIVHVPIFNVNVKNYASSLVCLRAVITKFHLVLCLPP